MLCNLSICSPTREALQWVCLFVSPDVFVFCVCETVFKHYQNWDPSMMNQSSTSLNHTRPHRLTHAHTASHTPHTRPHRLTHAHTASHSQSQTETYFLFCCVSSMCVNSLCSSCVKDVSVERGDVRLVLQFKHWSVFRPLRSARLTNSKCFFPLRLKIIVFSSCHTSMHIFTFKAPHSPAWVFCMHTHEEVGYLEVWQTDVGMRVSHRRSSSRGLPLCRFSFELEPKARECSEKYAHQYM